MKVYNTIYEGTFLRRPNRFVVEFLLAGKVVSAHLPNPGRMWELLFSGVKLYAVYTGGAGKKTDYRIIGIERDGVPISLDTNYSNDVAAYLIDHQQIPGWERWHVLQREYTVGKSRFDLLLGCGVERFLLEVKSCTLFSQTGAMFPDAITERGKKHVLHLAALAETGEYHAGVLFLVQWERAQWFLPDYHTDIEFAEAFYGAAPQLDWKAVAVRWAADFSIPSVVRTLRYKPELLEKEAHDGGDYLLVIQVETDVDITVGAKGVLHFPCGYYIYVGSAKKNLAKRMARHGRLRKQFHWHIDYLRQVSLMVATLPIRTSDDLEHVLAAAIKKIAGWEILGFGCTDCHCRSHLFGMEKNPIHDRAFMQVVEEFRMNRLDRLIK